MNWLPWTLFVFASAVAFLYWWQYTKAVEMNIVGERTADLFEATIRSQTQSIAYFKDQNNRLRSLLHLSVDAEVEPSDKVIVLSRRRKSVANPLTPRTL